MEKDDYVRVLKQTAQLAGCAVLLLMALFVGSIGVGIWYFPDLSKSEEHKELLKLYSVINIGMSKDEVMQRLPPHFGAIKSI